MLGMAGPMEAVDVPVGGQGVEEFLWRVGFHHPVVEAEALDGLGDPAGGVVDRGQADLVISGAIWRRRSVSSARSSG